MIRLGLIGYPLGHSLSPRLHTAALQACDLQGIYSLYPVEPGDIQSLGILLDQVRSGELTGLNVTIPHKQTVIQLVDELTPGASAISAVNVIYLKQGKLIGDNTDAPGFLMDLNSFLHKDPVSIEEKSALVLGAGGSARAIVYALEQAGWTTTIAARRIEQAQAFATSRVRVAHYDSSHISPLLSDIHLIVNTTPVGMYPNTDSSPWIDGMDFPKEAALYDLVYNPRVTRLVKQARAAGLRATTGAGMLIELAALSFQLWTGQDVPRSVMASAINGADR